MSAEQLNRIVQLVAELNRDAAKGKPAPKIDALARRLGTTPVQIQRDVATLTAASDEASHDWLASIGIQQEGDRLSITSQGPFRRPVRLTPMELLAIQVGLAAEKKQSRAPLLKALNALIGDEEEPVQLAPAATAEERILGMCRQAIAQRQVLLIKYAGESDKVGRNRTIEPHEVVYHDGHYYLNSWCRGAGDWRFFRADRVLDAELLIDTFDRRPDVPVLDGVAFRSSEPDEAVDVRFSPDVARFVREERPDCRTETDGGVEVTFHVSDPHWLVRKVLSYGADAEIRRPVEYRHAIRKFIPTAHR